MAEENVNNQPAGSSGVIQADQQGVEPVGDVPINQEIDNQEEAVADVPINTGLEEYLKKTADGKRVFKKYSECVAKKKPLPNKTKSLLVREVIRRERNYLLKNVPVDEVLNKFEIKSERFQLLAQEIGSIFKYEYVGRYYTPSSTEGKVVVPASGKLWYHFNYVKTVLREEKLLKKKEPREVQDILDADIIVENDNDDLLWLGNHLEPWDEIIVKWERSHAARRVLLVGGNLSVYDYIDKFPCLKNQRASELFSADFKLLHPDKTFVTEDKWKKIKDYLKLCLSDANIQTIEDRTILALLKSEALNPEKEDFTILYLLCHLVKPKRSGKRKRCQNAAPPQKLSLQERRETFILRVETANDITPKLLDLVDRHMQDHSTVQPAIVAVGPAPNIENYYVVVNEKLFAAKTILEAVELALKVFFCLDCKYPQNSQSIWIFLQKVLFNIDLPSDLLSSEVSEHIEYIRKL